MRGTRALMEVRISYEIVLAQAAIWSADDFRVALTAEENNLISLLNISYIGNIYHSQIHAHSAGHWRALTAD